MLYRLDDIKMDVRVILDENKVNTALIASDTDTLDLNTIIEQKVLHAIRSVSEAAPSRLIDEGTAFSSSITWESGSIGNGMGFLVLPDDFMRLVIFKMSDWRRPVVDVIQDTDPIYFLQKSKFAGIRGGIDKPVVAITTRSAGRVLEFYSSNGGSSVTLEVGKYLKLPIVDSGNVDICRRLYIPVSYYTAGLVALTFNEPERAKNLFEISNDYIK